MTDHTDGKRPRKPHRRPPRAAEDHCRRTCGAGGPRRLHAPGAGGQSTKADFSSLKDAKIDWQQAKGSSITIGVIPAGYFNNLEAVLPAFKDLTGIDVRFEKTPPGQIRQKAVLDLSSKTGNWASHAADPMYYPLYVSNGWVDPLDTYLGDAKTDRRQLVRLRRHLRRLARRHLDGRQALRHPL